MKASKQRGAAIDHGRMAHWVDSFRFYRGSPREAEIKAWLCQFDAPHQDLAARVLDSVEVVSEATIQQGYKAALDSIPGWNRVARDREGKWVFTGFGGPSESGLAMLRVFREANHLNNKSFDSVFCNVVEIPKKKLSAEDTVVLVDDFAGTGEQITKRWPQLTELIACDARCILILTAATVEAIEKIESKTTLEVKVRERLHKNDNFFSRSCLHFSEGDRTHLLPYCKRADAQNPKGFGECGLLYVLNHKTPNNSLPVLHANHSHWTGLFPRNLHPAG